MHRFKITIENCSRATTREGDHPDDVMYMNQLGQTIADSLAQLHFVGSIRMQLIDPDDHFMIRQDRQYPIVRVVT